MNAESMDASWLTLIRIQYTRLVYAWLKGPENAAIVAAQCEVAGRFDEKDTMASMLRSHVLQMMTPDGGFAHDPGGRMEILIRIIEAGIAVIDWTYIAKKLLNDHFQGR